MNPICHDRSSLLVKRRFCVVFELNLIKMKRRAHYRLLFGFQKKLDSFLGDLGTLFSEGILSNLGFGSSKN